MVFDIEMIKKVYSSMKDKVDIAKKVCNHPLTLSEKILSITCFNPKIKINGFMNHCISPIMPEGFELTKKLIIEKIIKKIK